MIIIYKPQGLEMRILHLQPSEFLLQEELSPPTEKLVNYHAKSGGRDKRRIERMSDSMLWTFDTASKIVAHFYEGKKASKETEKILSLPQNVIICLGVLITHLKSYALDTTFLITSNFHNFVSSSTMFLPATTMLNLEILQSKDTGDSKGSLFWLLNNTTTPFGARMLRKWIQQPLISKE